MFAVQNVDISSDTWCVATDQTNVFISVPITKEGLRKCCGRLKQTAVYFYGLTSGLH